MSDGEFPEYQDRSEAELERLQQKFRRPVRMQYVAAPAPGFDVHGLWHSFNAHSRTGYAAHAISLQWMLTRALGISTQLVPHRNSDIDLERFPADRYEMLFNWYKEAVGWPHVVFCSFPIDTSAEMDGVGPPLVPYCAFEGTRVSRFCVDLCATEAFKSVWVVSRFVKSAFVAGGVSEKKVRVVRPMLCGGPWELPDWQLLAGRKQRPITQEDPFTFGVLGSWQRRKGMHDLVRAYFAAFRREEPVRLVIRTSAFDHYMTIRGLKEKLTEEVTAIAAEFEDDGFPASQKMPRLGFQLGLSLTDAEVIDWLGSLDCYANPSYGEGLGIPHVWSKMMGVPLVSSGYGAIGELLEEVASNVDWTAREPNRDVVFPYRNGPIDPEIFRANIMFDASSEWGGYEVADLASSLRKSFEAGRVFDAKGADYVRKAFSVEACLPAVREGLRELVEPDWIGKWCV